MRHAVQMRAACRTLSSRRTGISLSKPKHHSAVWHRCPKMNFALSQGCTHNMPRIPQHIDLSMLGFLQAIACKINGLRFIHKPFFVARILPQISLKKRKSAWQIIENRTTTFLACIPTGISVRGFWSGNYRTRFPALVINPVQGCRDGPSEAPGESHESP